MNAKRMALALAAATCVGSAAYVFIYLYRWEWNRAIIAGIFLLASEMALATALIVKRVNAAAAPVRNEVVVEQVLARLRQSDSPPRDHFAWLRPTGTSMSVFVPVLMGAGFVLSALAWAVERLARATAKPSLERGLAQRLAAISLPEDQLVPRRGRDAVSLLLAPKAPDLW